MTLLRRSRVPLFALFAIVPLATRAAGDLLATWNGGQISEADYRKLAALVKLENGRSPDQLAGDQLQAARYFIVRTAAEAHISYAAAQKAGVVVSAAELDADWNEFVKSSGGEANAAKRLAEAGITREELMASRRLFLGRNKYLAGVIPEPKVEDAEVHQTYDLLLKQRPAMFKVPVRWQYAHIVLGTRPGMSATDIAALKKKAEDVRAMAAKPGADFGALAKQYSSDSPSRDQGGLLPPLSREQLLKLPAPFGATALALKTPGAIAPLIRTKEAGFHIIKFVHMESAHTVSFVQAQPLLTERIKQQKGERAAQEKVSALLKTADLKMLIELPPVPASATQSSPRQVPGSVAHTAGRSPKTSEPRSAPHSSPSQSSPIQSSPIQR